MFSAAHFILYVQDQQRSTAFYTSLLAYEPRLHVPGMTEYQLPGGGILGLMPESGIRQLLGAALPDAVSTRGAPRAELYLVVPEPGAYHARALAAGGRELSPMLSRSWGDVATYSLDPDGYILAFATATALPPNKT